MAREYENPAAPKNTTDLFENLQSFRPGYVIDAGAEEDHSRKLTILKS